MLKCVYRYYMSLSLLAKILEKRNPALNQFSILLVLRSLRCLLKEADEADRRAILKVIANK